MGIVNISDFSLYKQYEYQETDGDSRWAELGEISCIDGYLSVEDITSGISSGGVPIVNDSENGKLILDTSDTSSIVIGSTRSTKTRRICYQTVLSLISARESVVCYDPKGEIYNKTSGYAQATDYGIYVLNLRDPRYSNSWNMLEAAWKLYHSGERDASEEMIMDLARAIAYCDENKSYTDPYWLNMTENIFSLLANMLMEKSDLESCNIKSLLALRSILYYSSDSRNGDLCSGDTHTDIRDIVANLPKDSIMFSQAQAFTSAPDVTRESALSSFDAKMRIFFSQDGLTEVLSKGEIDFYELCRKPSIVYIVAPDEKKTYASIVSQFIKQMISTFIKICHVIKDDDLHENGKLVRRMNFVLDEFAQIEGILDFDSICSACLSRNLRFVLILQNLYQLYSRYGESCAETIIDNCPNIYYFTTNEPALLNRVSELCGIGRDGERLISLARLRRLDCRNGRVLIINKLHYPFVSCLDDIEKEGSAFLDLLMPPVEFKKRESNETAIFNDVDGLLDWD